MIPTRRKNKQDITSPKSKNSKKVKELKELVLPASKLKFCTEQLQNLNFVLTTRILESFGETEKSKPIILARSITERLLQRLLCSVSQQDARFSSKYLISLHDTNYELHTLTQKLEYIVRLDALSIPTLYSKDEHPQYVITEGGTEMCPSGYARLRLSGNSAKKWSEFLNSGGYLRRDKIQARLVELLAAATTCKEVIDLQNDIDESNACGSPGKVVDPLTMHHISKISAERHVFYGPVGNYPRFPDPRDFRLAIVDEPSGIRIKIGFMSPALSNVNVEVRFYIAIGIDSWPSSTDFPFRIPLWHTDSLLYYRSAQTGMYLVGYGVHSSAWQIRFPAAEKMFLKNYSSFSTVSVLLKSLEKILEDINRQNSKGQLCHKILNKYIIQTCVFSELEKDSFPPLEVLMNWSPIFLSTLVLQILDNLILSLRDQFLPNYFFKNANLLANPGHLCEDDYNLEANKIKAVMLKMFDESLTSLKSEKDFKKFLTSQNTETALLMKWKNLVEELTPPFSNKGGKMLLYGGRVSKNSRDCSSYTNRQLESVGIVLKHVLLVKEKLLQANQDNISYKGASFFEPESVIDDIIYILVTIMEQARDQYIEKALYDQEKLKPLSKMKANFDKALTKLVEIIRKDKDIQEIDLSDDKNIVKIILKWLYKGLDHNKQSFAPVLKPYLKNIFIFSNAMSWHLETITKREYKDELEAMGVFAKLVTAGQITPAQGLIDSVNKNWNWAKNMLCNVENCQLRLVFSPTRGKTVRHVLFLPKEEQEKVGNVGMTTLDLIKNTLTRNGYQTLPNKSCFSTFNKKDSCIKITESIPQHFVLRDSSPMTLCISKIHRNGDHRCAGDLIESFISIQKISILQEISSSLSGADELGAIDSVQHLISERNKKNSFRSNSHTFHTLRRCRKSEPMVSSIQRYIPKEESAGIRIDESNDDGKKLAEKKLIRKSGFGSKEDSEGCYSLIGSCRAARVREDTNIIYFHDSFKVRSVSKTPSFKY